ncbi:MAG TPA: tRNA lysidine(34) synthetase TilS [Thermoanaerobaculia bacterium]|nr:tRNA lysidine(34) synthetase TilS [Thermoanaerobaculia bacterium]
MGSSPVTATISRAARAAAALESTLEDFLAVLAPPPGALLLVAFSGGPDSTALLWGLTGPVRRRGLRLAAAHLDHGLDPDSAQRAVGAAQLAARLGVPLAVDRRPVGELRRRGESLEEAARRVRYDFLLEEVERSGAAALLTAHHRDDQAETVLLRLLGGSGLEGLAGIRARAGRLHRPLLGLSRATLREALASTGISPLEDPTNLLLDRPRNRLRWAVVPALASQTPAIAARLGELAATAAAANAVIDRVLARRLRPVAAAGRVRVRAAALRDLPGPLRAAAAAFLHRRAGSPHPPSRRACAELFRQLDGGHRVGCDAGGGWRWESRRDALWLTAPCVPAAPFTYTFAVPGECEIRELGARLRVRRATVEPWMRRGEPARAGIALALADGEPLTVRTRRPGDRLRPLGAPGERRLKEVLIDRGMARPERDRLPLLCHGERILWVPGVTVAEDCRLGDEPTDTWLAEIEPLPPGTRPDRGR